MGGYSDWLKYVNQINPATGMYWQQADVAKATGLDPTAISNYLTSAQQANLANVMGGGTPLTTAQMANVPQWNASTMTPTGGWTSGWNTAPATRTTTTGYPSTSTGAASRTPVTTSVAAPVTTTQRPGLTAPTPAPTKMNFAPGPDYGEPSWVDSWSSVDRPIGGGATPPVSTGTRGGGGSSNTSGIGITPQNSPSGVRVDPNYASIFRTARNTQDAQNRATYGPYGSISTGGINPNAGGAPQYIPNWSSIARNTLPTVGGGGSNRTGTGGTGTGTTPAGTGGTSSIPPWQMPNFAPMNPNPFINSSGGFGFGALPGMFNQIYSASMPAYLSALQSGLGTNTAVSNYLLGNLPQNLPPQLLSWIQSLGNSGGNMMGNAGNYLGGQFLPTMQGNLSYLNQYGLPGNQQLQQEQQALGLANGIAGNLLGANGNYGVQQLLQQIYTQGLPGQRSIEGIVGPASQAAISGGLTPEFVNAMKGLVLQPMQERYQGMANQQGGGVASVPTFNQDTGEMTSAGSPLLAELGRRNERDFNNQLIAAGFGNQAAMGNLANQAFGNVAQSAYPYVGLGANTGLNALQQATQNFATGSGYGLQNLQTIQNLAMQPYLAGQQGLETATGLGQGQQNSWLSALQNLMNSQNQLAMGQGGLNVDILRQLSALYGQQRGIESGQQQASAAALGGLAQSGINALPYIFQALGWL